MIKSAIIEDNGDSIGVPKFCLYIPMKYIELSTNSSTIKIFFSGIIVDFFI